jgi:cation/acetate symporter
VAGPSGLPHVLMRFYTVPTAKEARRSAAWAIGLIGAFFLITLVLGMGAAKLVGQQAILAAPGGANAAAPLLALELGGEIFMGVISGVAFATILAVVAGLTITASASFAHDVYNSILKDGKADPEQEVKVARITSVVIGVLAIIGGIVANGQNIAFLISLAFAVAASANLPSILYTMYWKRFTTRGSVWSIYTGLISSVVLIVFSPVDLGLEDGDAGRGGQLRVVPADQPGARLGAAGLPGRLARHRHVAGARRRGAGHRDGGPLHDRRRRGRGDRPLSSDARRGRPLRDRPRHACAADYSAVSGRMSIRHPVSRAARRAF